MNRNQTAITLARNGAVYLGRNQHKRQIGEWNRYVQGQPGRAITKVFRYQAGTLGAKKNVATVFVKRHNVVEWFKQLVREGQFDAN